MAKDLRTGWLADVKVGDEVWTKWHSTVLFGPGSEYRPHKITRISATGFITVSNNVRYRPDGSGVSFYIWLVPYTDEVANEVKRLELWKAVSKAMPDKFNKMPLDKLQAVVDILQSVSD